MAKKPSFLTFPSHRISELRKAKEEKRALFLQSQAKTREQAKALIPPPLFFFLKNPRSTVWLLLAAMTFLKLLGKNTRSRADSKAPSFVRMLKNSVSGTVINWAVPLAFRFMASGGLRTATLFLRKMLKSRTTEGQD